MSEQDSSDGMGFGAGLDDPTGFDPTQVAPSQELPPEAPLPPQESDWETEQTGPTVDEVPETEECCVPTDREFTALPGAESWAPHGSLLMIVDGQTVDLGIPTLDFDGDGLPESTLLQGAEGEQYLVVDLTGDAMADGLAIADPNGNLVAGFTFDETGVPTEIEIPAGMTLTDLLSQPAPASLAPEAEGQEPWGADQPVIGPLDGDDGTMDAGGIGKNVVFHDGNELIDLGPATHDFDGDGKLESVVLPDEQGRPAYVVLELTETGEMDGLLVLDPASGQVIQEFTAVEGQILQPDGTEAGVAPTEGVAPSEIGVAPAEGVDPLAPADPLSPEGSLSGPEKILAPTIETYGNPMLAMTAQMSQQMYDVASQVWFDLTGGQPYPRSENGTPLDPGMVFATLQDMPSTPEDAKDELQQMQMSYLNILGYALGPSEE